MTKTALREELATIVIKAAARGPKAASISRALALRTVDALIASPDAPEWDACLVGADVLRKVIAIYHTL